MGGIFPVSVCVCDEWFMARRSGSVSVMPRWNTGGGLVGS